MHRFLQLVLYYVCDPSTLVRLGALLLAFGATSRYPDSLGLGILIGVLATMLAFHILARWRSMPTAEARCHHILGLQRRISNGEDVEHNSRLWLNHMRHMPLMERTWFQVQGVWSLSDAEKRGLPA